MSNTITGKLKLIQDTQTFDSGFQKREFVVTTAEQYPQDIKLEFVKDKCSVLDSYQIGQEVTVDFNLRGNEYNGKYYVNLQAWRVASGQSAPVQTQSAPVPSAPVEDDDEPF